MFKVFNNILVYLKTCDQILDAHLGFRTLILLDKKICVIIQKKIKERTLLTTQKILQNVIVYNNIVFRLIPYDRQCPFMPNFTNNTKELQYYYQHQISSTEYCKTLYNTYQNSSRFLHFINAMRPKRFFSGFTLFRNTQKSTDWPCMFTNRKKWFYFASEKKWRNSLVRWNKEKSKADISLVCNWSRFLWKKIVSFNLFCTFQTIYQFCSRVKKEHVEQLENHLLSPVCIIPLFMKYFRAQTSIFSILCNFTKKT